MDDSASVIFDEVLQLVEQYKLEVPGGRKAWPESIKTRVLELNGSGFSLPKISERTGISYHTLLNWRDQKAEAFKEVTVSPPALPEPTQSVATVTVVKKRKYTKSQSITVTVGNIKIDGLDVGGLLKVLARINGHSI